MALFFGCVERRITIRTDPPGAMAYIDDYQIGTTPISTNFTYYGTRKIRLVKDGFKTKVVYQRIPPPWYQIPPLDFVTENIILGTIRDHRTLTYQLEADVVVPPEHLLQRAEQFRSEAYAPLPSVEAEGYPVGLSSRVTPWSAETNASFLAPQQLQNPRPIPTGHLPQSNHTGPLRTAPGLTTPASFNASQPTSEIPRLPPPQLPPSIPSYP